MGDNKFASLNTAAWSGGSFVYVPKGVHVEIPLQAYFRINTENMGQFERTLIIADEDSYVHYIEGCTAPIYTSDSLHSAVVEIIVKKGARVRYTTIQNWSNNVYNLVTKRAICEEGATMEWVDGNIGSKVTMKYPAVYLVGEHAKGETLSIAFAGEGQHQDTGSKMVHIAPNTSARRSSPSRWPATAAAPPTAAWSRSARAPRVARNSVECDALLVDQISRSDTYPYIDVREDDVTMGHEATVSRVSEEQLFYLMSRGMTEDEAMAMIVRGFIEPIARELPMEYATGTEPPHRTADGRIRRLIMTDTATHETGEKARIGAPSISGFTEEGENLSPLNEAEVSSPIGGDAAKAHSHGGGAGIPDSSRAGRMTSYNLEDFPALTGREEDFRFTPLKRLGGLHKNELTGAAPELSVEARQGLPRWKPLRMTDARVGSAGIPEDRVSANAWKHFSRGQGAHHSRRTPAARQRHADLHRHLHRGSSQPPGADRRSQLRGRGGH